MIDFHTHPVLIKEIVEQSEKLTKAVRKVFNLQNALQPLETFKKQMEVAGIAKSVLLPIDCSTAHDCKIFSNEQIADLARDNDFFIGFASVDPHKREAPEQLTKAVVGLGLKGLKLDPSLQQFYPNDKEKAYPVFKEASRLKIPVVIHAGMTWESDAMMKYSHPSLLEDVAHDFPKLKIVIAHMGWPWVLDSVALALKYPNVYLDTSCLYADTPREFIEYVFTKQVPITLIERSLNRKIVFGSNYPRIETHKMVTAVKNILHESDVVQNIFHTNASELLGQTSRE
nr:amidohydrolase family protein [Candidatus Njordarchaeum guaymaensis]